MLLQVLHSFEERFDIQFKLYLVYDSVPGVSQDMDLFRQWAIKDANYIARQYGLEEVTAYPNARAYITGQQTWQLEVKNLTDALRVFKKTWFDEFPEYYQASTPVMNFQINNQKRLISKGHYSPAAIFFCGDWFVGVDRLYHFEQRLQFLHLHREGELHCFEKNKLQLLADRNLSVLKNRRLEVYISLRSPFSYLGCIQAHRLATHYGLELVIKLIVPMKMRGAFIPDIKQKYTFLDATREAERLEIPFTSFTDPQVQGIINCYQIFAYAEQQNKGYDLVKSVYEAVFVNGVTLSHITQVQALCQKIDLDFEAAHQYAKEHDWQATTDENLQILEGLNFWGVPCYRYQDTSVWGQDRIAQIEEAIINDLKSAETQND